MNSHYPREIVATEREAYMRTRVIKFLGIALLLSISPPPMAHSQHFGGAGFGRFHGYWNGGFNSQPSFFHGNQPGFSNFNFPYRPPMYPFNNYYSYPSPYNSPYSGYSQYNSPYTGYSQYNSPYGNS